MGSGSLLPSTASPTCALFHQKLASSSSSSQASCLSSPPYLVLSGRATQPGYASPLSSVALPDCKTKSHSSVKTRCQDLRPPPTTHTCSSHEPTLLTPPSFTPLCPGTMCALLQNAFPPTSLPGKIPLGHYDSAQTSPCPRYLPCPPDMLHFSLVYAPEYPTRPF